MTPAEMTERAEQAFRAELLRVKPSAAYPVQEPSGQTPREKWIDFQLECEPAPAWARHWETDLAKRLDGAGQVLASVSGQTSHTNFSPLKGEPATMDGKPVLRVSVRMW